jgi:hypothetical protein
VLLVFSQVEVLPLFVAFIVSTLIVEVVDVVTEINSAFTHSSFAGCPNIKMFDKIKRNINIPLISTFLL